MATGAATAVREALRRASHDDQASQNAPSSSSTRRPSYTHDPFTGAEPPDFDPSRPASAAARRPSYEQSLLASASRSRSSSQLAEAFQLSTSPSGANGFGGAGGRGVTKMASRDGGLGSGGGFRAATPEHWQKELERGEEARGSSARRRSEDAAMGIVAGGAGRKGSMSSLRREVGQAGISATPRRDSQVAEEEDEAEELTPRAAAAGSSKRTSSSVPPRTRQSSGGSLSSASKPLHTPPTLFPGGVRSHLEEYSSPARSASSVGLATTPPPNRQRRPSTAPSTLPASDAVDTSRASSPDSRSHSSLSSEPGDEWATSHLDTTSSSPPRSPLLAETARQARISFLAQAVSGARESRPISEFDFAAAYASSEPGSLPSSPAVQGAGGFVMEKIDEREGMEDHPLPPIPPSKGGTKEEQPLPSAPHSQVASPQIPPFNLFQPIPSLQAPPPTSASISLPPSSSSLSVLSPSAASLSELSTGHLSPVTASFDPPRPSSALSNRSEERPGSRSSTRSPKPQPPRPPRRQASSLSLMSQKSGNENTGGGGGGGTGISPVLSPALDTATPLSPPPPPVPSHSEDPPSALTSAVPPPIPTASPLPSAPSTTSLSSPSPSLDPSLSPARARPRGATLSSATGSIRSRGPPPNLPEKSRRRTSALLSSPGGRRLSMSSGGVGKSPSMELAGFGGGGGEEENRNGREKGKEREREREGREEADVAKELPDPQANRFSVATGFTEPYLRDSFYDSYATSIAPSSPPSVPSHFREASSIDHSPAASPIISPPDLPPPLPSPPSLIDDSGLAPKASGLGRGSVSSNGSRSTAGPDDYQDALSIHSLGVHPRSASALSSVSSAYAGDRSRSVTPATVARTPEPFPFPQLAAEMEAARLAASSPMSVGSAGKSRSGTPKGDAKARAAAFIADLKRAKVAAASAENSPVIAQGSRAASRAQGQEEEEEEDDEDETDMLVISASNGPLSPSVILSPSVDFSATSSPMLPSLPASPAIPDSPMPQQRTARSGSTFTTTTMRSAVSSPPLPPFPTMQSKRPSQSSILSISSIGHPRPIAPSSPSALPALPVDPSAPLLRRRPLPSAIQAAKELKSARTPRERARIYAEKINELARESSRLEEWIGSVRNVGHAIGRSPIPSSPSTSKLNRSSRQEGSTATFAPRGDGYRAREIPSHSFSSRDLVANAPYPGVIGLAASKYSLASSNSSSKSSFFSGLGRGSLGRKASKHGHPPSFSSSSSQHHHSSTGPAGGVRTASISGPIALDAKLTSVSTSTSNGMRSISGPRMPNPTPPGRHRASVDGSPSSSPILDRGGGGQGRTGAFGGGRVLGATTEEGEGESGYEIVEYEDGGDAAVDEDKILRLADVLPAADKADLVAALRDAGGDDVLAISVYLSSEASRR